MTVARLIMGLLGTMTVLVLLFGYDTSTAGPLVASSAHGSVSSSGGTASSGSGSGTTSGGTSTTSGDTVTGPSVNTRWGPVQVQLTMSGDTITAVDVVQYPDGNRRDQEINARALPILVRETLDAQSADIDMVSGATVTSDGYVSSLQAALDEARA